MFDSFKPRLGSPNPLARRLAAPFERGLHELLASAFERWAATGYVRYDDGEIAITAVLINHIDTICRERGSSVMPQPESVTYSRAIREGRVDPRTAPRPDIKLMWGRVRDDRNM